MPHNTETVHPDFMTNANTKESEIISILFKRAHVYKIYGINRSNIVETLNIGRAV